MGTTQIILIVLIGLLLITYPILMFRRNKKENQKVTEMANSLKRGDKILTTSGVYGKIVDLKMDGEAKKVVIETGDEKSNKSYLTIDAYAIYTVLNDAPVKAPEETKKAEEKVEENKVADKKEEKKIENKKTEVKKEESVKVENDKK